MADDSTTRDLFALPKAHLHIHLEGGMRADTLVELAAAYGIPMPTIRGFGSFSAFSDMYVAACDVLRTPDDMARLCRETLLDGVESGATYVEPATYLPHHRTRLGDDQRILDIMLDAFTSAGREYGIAWGLMIAGDRTVDPSDAVQQAHLAVANRDRGVVSFGLANDEAVGPPEPFAEAFAIARQGGLLSTPHAGELAGPESVRGAVDTLGANRVQHGVRVIEDPELMKRLADEGVCCDVCPTSNILLSVFPDLASHPLGAMLDAGIPCSINADDPLLFGPGLLSEYQLCRDELGLSDAQLATAAMASFEHSGATDEVKRAGLGGIATWLRG
jgi:adenosine deaminase